jgi:hypothetical protein
MTADDVKELLAQGICPMCQDKLHHKEGCMECDACGWSSCKEA